MAECKHAHVDWGSNQLGHADYAERKMAQGEMQKWCRNCKLYIWESEWDRAAKTELIDGRDDA